MAYSGNDKKIVSSEYLYKSLENFNQVREEKVDKKLFEDKENKIIDVPESYTRCLDTDTGALKVVADGLLTDATIEIEISAVVGFIDDITEGEYVLHTDEVSHMETETVSIYMPREETYDKQTIDDKITEIASGGLKPMTEAEFDTFWGGLTITASGYVDPSQP